VVVFFDSKAQREEQLLRAAYPGYERYAARVRHRVIPGLV
jgi:protein-S-isoprenylcysteine O-methyltransferase Ste14